MLQKTTKTITTQVTKCICPFCGKPEIDDVENLMEALINHVTYECDEFFTYSSVQKHALIPGHRENAIVTGVDGQVWAILYEDDYDLAIITSIMPISLEDIKVIFNDEFKRLQDQGTVLAHRLGLAEAIFEGMITK